MRDEDIVAAIEEASGRGTRGLSLLGPNREDRLLDAKQDAAVTLLRVRGRLRQESLPALAWQTIKCRAIDRARADRRLAPTAAGQDMRSRDADPVGEAIVKETWERIFSLLDHRSARDRAVILRRIGGEALSAIAASAEIQCSVATACRVCARFRAELAQLLAGQ